MSTAPAEVVSTPRTITHDQVPVAAPLGLVRAFDRFAAPLTRRSIIPVAALLTFLIGAGDLVTGIELPFTILYMLPIGLATWFHGRRLGVVASVLATGFIALSLVYERMSPLSIIWNVAGAAVLFLAASWGIEQVRSHMEHERALRRMAVDELRHAERLRVIGTLAAGVAHELGTPLNVIAGCAEFLAEDAGDERVRRRTSMILEQVTKISTIIRHLLDFGRRSDVARTRVDLRALATTTTEMLRPAARKRGITIECHMGEPVWVTGNPAELEQVLSNLILNGVQAMNRGTIHVRAAMQVRALQQVASFEVEDEGCGIPLDDLPRIFDPFFTTKGVGEGTGLGLSVSYGIICDHHGSIEVTSEPGRGSRFTVLMPTLV